MTRRSLHQAMGLYCIVRTASLTTSRRQEKRGVEWRGQIHGNEGLSTHNGYAGMPRFSRAHQKRFCLPADSALRPGSNPIQPQPTVSLSLHGWFLAIWIAKTCSGSCSGSLPPWPSALSFSLAVPHAFDVSYSSGFILFAPAACAPEAAAAAADAAAAAAAADCELDDPRRLSPPPPPPPPAPAAVPPEAPLAAR